MIVRDSDILLSALERRLQVDRILTLEPLRAIGDAGDAAPGVTPGASPDPSLSNAAAPKAPIASGPQAVSDLPTRLPLGQVVAARVVEIGSTGEVIAEIGTKIGADPGAAAASILRVSLAWPKGGGDALVPGRTIALRVLAHRPMLLFQSAEVDPVDAAERDSARGAPARWSSDALSLQTRATSTPASGAGRGPLRFDIPILEIEAVPLGAGANRDVVETMPARPRQAYDGPVTASSIDDANAWTSTTAISTGWDRTSRIGLDDVIVAHGTALVDGVESPLIARLPSDHATPAPAFVPIALQGPAWPGQPMELVVRREREDEQFDNPALDHWCGEVVLDLPRLGRVAGHLSFSMQGLKVRLEGDDVGVAAMSAAAVDLAAALADADLRVAGLVVARPSADTTRSVSPRPVADQAGVRNVAKDRRDA